MKMLEAIVIHRPSRWFIKDSPTKIGRYKKLVSPSVIGWCWYSVLKKLCYGGTFWRLYLTISNSPLSIMDTKIASG